MNQAAAGLRNSRTWTSLSFDPGISWMQHWYSRFERAFHGVNLKPCIWKTASVLTLPLGRWQALSAASTLFLSAGNMWKILRERKKTALSKEQSGKSISGKMGRICSGGGCPQRGKNQCGGEKLGQQGGKCDFFKTMQALHAKQQEALVVADHNLENISQCSFLQKEWLFCCTGHSNVESRYAKTFYGVVILFFLIALDNTTLRNRN